MGKIMDAAFIDRDDPKKAIEGLQKVEELARKGLSILIAPEGTRLDTTEVGPFKKGPFRIAMSAGIPIVPDRDPQRRGHRRPRLEHLQPRHRRRRGVPADPRRRLDAREPVRTHRRGASALPRHAQGLAARRAAHPGAVHPREAEEGRQGAGEEGAPKKAPAKKAPAKKPPAKKAPAKKPPAKKAPAKKAAAKQTATKRAARRAGREGRR